jgi:hypothetical protein
MRFTRFVGAALGVMLLGLLPQFTPAHADEPCQAFGIVFEGTPWQRDFGTVCGESQILATGQSMGEYTSLVTNQLMGEAEGCEELGTYYVGTQYEINMGRVCGVNQINAVRQSLVEYHAWVATQPAPVQNCIDFGTIYPDTPYSRYIGNACGDQIAIKQAEITAHSEYVASMTAGTSSPPPGCDSTPRPSWCTSNSQNSGGSQNSSGTQSTGSSAPQSSADEVAKKSETPAATSQIPEKKTSSSSTKKKASPSPSPISAAVKTIKCIKSGKTITVKGKNPKCPAGYRKAA